MDEKAIEAECVELDSAYLILSRLSASTLGTGLLLLPVLAAALLGTVFSRRFVPTISGTLTAPHFLHN